MRSIVSGDWDGYWAVKPKKIVLGNWNEYFKDKA